MYNYEPIEKGSVSMQKYGQEMYGILANSQQTFEQLQTPGWSSIVKSQISRQSKAGTKTMTLQQQIMNKLNQTKINSSTKQQFSKIRLPQPNTGKNILLYNANTNQTGTEQQNQSSETNKKNNIQRINNQYDKIKQINYKNSNIENIKSNKTEQKYIQNKIKQQNNKIKLKSRFKQITVHQYLYQNSLKMKNKKMLEKIIDQQYRHQNIETFRPIINLKSQKLAQSKYSRLKQQESSEWEIHQSQINNQQIEKDQQNKNDSQKLQRYKILNKTFYHLSEDELLINKNKLLQTIQKLPLPCIKSLKPVIEIVYRGGNLCWLQFLNLFNNGTIKQQQSFYFIMDKWLKRQYHILSSQDKVLF